MARVKNIDSNKYGQEWGATGIAPAVQTTATILENSSVVSYKDTRTICPDFNSILSLLFISYAFCCCC